MFNLIQKYHIANCDGIYVRETLLLVTVANTYKKTILIITEIILSLTNSKKGLYPVERSILKAPVAPIHTRHRVLLKVADLSRCK